VAHVTHHPITIRREISEIARIVIPAETVEEAERLAHERASSGEVIWEEECRSMVVEVES
jgi:hypothetical protein